MKKIKDPSRSRRSCRDYCKYLKTGGDTDVCLKVLNRWNPFKKTIHMKGRAERIVAGNKPCKYYRRKYY